MALEIGSRLGPYEVISLLGAGGMGEVYRARDDRLGRDVAIKVLPDEVTRDPARVARFAREAQLLATLNHPNIGALYGLEESVSSEAKVRRGLILELVEGETLATLARHRRLSVSEALAVARQIAEALEAAHDKGIVHRDLKPANVMVTPTGVVKVLDFGLAKPIDESAVAGSDEAVTATAPHTRAGMVLGTAAYMSPEQARGQPLDRRTDLWALGAVLYELLARQPAFAAHTASDTLARVLTEEPEWAALPGDTPLTIRRMLRRCLQKDRRQRLDSAAAVRLEIVDAMTSPDAGTAAARRIPSLSFSAAAVAAAALLFVAGVWIGTRSATTPQAPIRLGIVLPPSQRQPIPEDTREIAISPDGRLIALRLDAVSGGRLALRALHELDAKVLPGIGNARSPFFSADGQWVGFFDGTTLQKVSVAGGPPIVIARDVVGEAASWGDDDTIVFAAGGGLWRVDPNGGTPIPVLAASHSEGDYTLPAVLPGSRAVLFTVRQRSPFVAGTSRRSVADADNVQIAVLDLATGTHKVLLRGATCAEYASSGHVLYAMAGTLFAVRFDLTRLEVQGVPVPVVEDVQMALNAGAASYTLSRSGSLAYVPGSARTRVLVWVDRHGVETPINAPPRAYHYLKLSPDGSRVALEVREEQDLYIWHFADATFTRLTFDPALDVIPAWTRDGKNVVFGSARDGRINLYMQAADGSGETRRLTKSDTAQFVNSVAPDGEHLLGVQWSERTLYDIFRFTLGGRAPPEVLVQTPAVDYAAMVSPNGRYFAYQSYESGRSEIYVRPFPVAASGRWQVSTGGGTAPVWAPDGRELFYLDHTRTLMALPVDTSSTFRSGTPRKVLDAGYAVPANFGVYDVSPTGEQFLMLKETGAANPDATPTSVVVVINWLSELASKLPTDRR